MKTIFLIGGICISIVIFISMTLLTSPGVPKYNETLTLTKDEIKMLVTNKILFGHQSVGSNILEGIKDLGIDFNIISKKIGENRQPSFKIQDFVQYVKQNPDINIAMMKFCYLDITTENAVSVFMEYKHQMQYLKELYPNIKFFHITVPLTVKMNMFKRLFKEDPNEARKYFNRLLIEEYGNAVFNLATVESSQSKTYSLSPSFTDDGGHLNLYGRKVVANQFMKFIYNQL
jgi:hypothetical protein